MFTETEMRRIEELAASRADVNEIASALHIHPTTLERRLLKNHGIVLERIRACRLKRVGTAAQPLLH